MTAVFATKISAFDPENISQRVLLTKERLYAIDQLNGEGRQQSFAAALLLEYVVKRQSGAPARGRDRAGRQAVPRQRAGHPLQPVAFGRMGRLRHQQQSGRRRHPALR